MWSRHMHMPLFSNNHEDGPFDQKTAVYSSKRVPYPIPSTFRILQNLDMAHYTHENIVLLQDPLGAFLVAGLFWETSKVLRWVAEINHINHVLKGGHKASFFVYTLCLCFWGFTHQVEHNLKGRGQTVHNNGQPTMLHLGIPVLC